MQNPALTDHLFSTSFEALQLRVGMPLPFTNPLPGEDNVMLGFSDQLFHLHYFLPAGLDNLKEIITEFQEADVYYALSEPMPGVAYLLVDIGGADDWTRSIPFHQATLTEDRRQVWQAQRKRLVKQHEKQATVPVVMTLTCTESHEVLAVRTLAVPAQFAVEARDVVNRVHAITPDDFIPMLHETVAEDLGITELLAFSSHFYMDVPSGRDLVLKQNRN